MISPIKTPPIKKVCVRDDNAPAQNAVPRPGFIVDKKDDSRAGPSLSLSPSYMEERRRRSMKVASRRQRVLPRLPPPPHERPLLACPESGHREGAEGEEEEEEEEEYCPVEALQKLKTEYRVVVEA
ncbi:uncharacterized protein LOC127750333 [Frankliniella occidentalis]|uniref:Uncharacterized protein LOC127750333 n=1 Tax=Frankliniella occidentalis TaxID=133901 RepID=A0A9C6X224_FRAOC|nr:uncharacterized protein LOC127750333 [Frankliniella occidentalis]